MRTSEQNVAEAIRRKIVAREFAPGERVTESSISKLIGVSRTPARGALRSLEMEGLIEKREGRGYEVRDTDVADLPKALKVRGVLEGLAARVLAENGIGGRASDRLEKSLAASEAIVRRGRLDAQGLETFRVANAVFHETIVQECNNDFVVYALDRLKLLPALNLAAFGIRNETQEPALMRLTVSHSQHAIVYKAIRDRDAARAEAMMREHANAAADYGDLFA
jgi:GntR family transcriptional regulator of vanillate catabolism